MRLLRRISAFGRCLAVLQKARDDVKRAMDEVPLPETRKTSAYAFDSYFFPNLCEVALVAGDLPNVKKVAPKLGADDKKASSVPRTNKVPRFQVSGMPGGGDGDSSGDSSDNDKPVRRGSEDRIPEAVEASICNRHTSPSSSILPQYPHPSPDPPGIGGIKFQDENPIWRRCRNGRS